MITARSKKYIALDKALFFVGDPIIHNNLGYTATIKKVCRRGNAIIEVPDTPQNSLVWGGNNLPKTFKALNIVKHFKHHTYAPTINL